MADCNQLRVDYWAIVNEFGADSPQVAAADEAYKSAHCPVTVDGGVLTSGEPPSSS